jgi:AcrR family transcriptional regulator
MRQSKGQRTREEILEAAIRLASVRGLEALSIGMLAAETGMSKAGLLAHFGSKQSLQLATVDGARELVWRRVLGPALAAPEGLPQLREFVQRHLDYIEQRVLPGGCFFTAISVEVDDQDGPVRERICQYLAQRDEAIAGLLVRARELGQIRPDTDIRQLVFEVLVLLQGTVVRYLLKRDPDVLARARRAVAGLLDRVVL